MGNEKKVIHSKHYPEIQGLRAVAVVMVLLFHFELLGAQGGFAGVDVFFVVSGFLMTSILQNRREQPALVLLSEFYSKRFWRIVPAYWVTILLVVLFGYAFLLPFDYDNLGRSSLYALGFVSNVYFASLDGYFSVEAIYKPLLHTWSLGVEVQFYLIWPLLFICVRRYSDFLQFLVLLAGGLVSFVGALYFSSLDPEFSFFGVITRIWEFAIGAALANSWLRPRLPLQQISNGIVQAVALLALIGFMFLGTNTLAWPAPFALIPTIATFILIAGNLGENHGLVSKALSSRPATWLGELSYSIYLVHWPLVCALNYYAWPNADWPMRTLVLLLSLPLAHLLHRIVEKPLRGKKHAYTKGSKRIVITCAIAVVAAGTILVLRHNEGFHNRYSSELNSTLARQFEHSTIPDKEIVCSATEFKCVEKRAPKQKVFLWGDSHAGHFAPALEQLSYLSGFAFESKVGGACPPLPNATRTDGALSFNTKCLASNEASFSKAISDTEINTVVLAARWAYYANAKRFGNEHGHPAFLAYGKSDEASVANSRHILKEQMSKIIEELDKANKRVVLIHQIPELSINGQRCYTMQKLRDQSKDICSIPLEQVSQRQASYRAIFARLAARFPNLVIVDPLTHFCDQNECTATLDKKLAYSDNNHILPGAAWGVLSKYRSQILNQ